MAMISRKSLIRQNKYGKQMRGEHWFARVEE